MPSTTPENQIPPLVVSRHKTARLIDCSLRHVDYLTERGSPRKSLTRSAQGRHQVSVDLEAGRGGRVSYGLPKCDESRLSMRLPRCSSGLAT
jgi:hypothetical protein